ncbi:hypothetical protein H5410_062032 [Solanum commersonii]|uniref:Uncharacterized protein n=1 Tax=Solanum commersonii TaxID=4109 RepID=A0A9J5W9M5_SOLCO|nr:hypothetical protein H5410_062032 [Solanum commersonii]
MSCMLILKDHSVNLLIILFFIIIMLKVTIELLYGVARLNLIESFSSFDIQKIMRMIALYSNDFDELSMCALENKLANNQDITFRVGGMFMISIKGSQIYLNF